MQKRGWTPGGRCEVRRERTAAQRELADVAQLKTTELDAVRPLGRALFEIKQNRIHCLRVVELRNFMDIRSEKSCAFSGFCKIRYAVL